MDKQLTYCDIIRAGACADGVIYRCKEEGVFVANVSEAVAAFPDEVDRIMEAAELDGNGDGNGNGYGNGDGNL